MAGNREDKLTAWLRRRLGPHTLLGDDAAVLPPLPPGARWVATVDSQIAGVHHPADLDLRLAARRLLAVNLSDAAAMGTEPRHALLALSGPPSLDRRRYFEGLLAACEEHGVTLAGGDLARTAKTVVATLTLLAELPAGRQPLLRSTARPGHDLWVGGTPGEAAVGLELLQRGAKIEAVDTDENKQISKGERRGRRPAEAEPGRDRPGRRGHLESSWRVVLPDFLPSHLADAARRAVWRHVAPEPQLALGRALAEAGASGAAMDVSDGLALDLSRLCRESGVGAEIDAGALPRSPAFADLCTALGLDPLQLALGGGEDYVLLFTLPATDLPPDGFACTKIGRITESRDLLLREGSHVRPLPTTGWDHLREHPAHRRIKARRQRKENVPKEPRTSKE